MAENFAAFEKEKDVTLVYEALETIEAAERDVPAAQVAIDPFRGAVLACP